MVVGVHVVIVGHHGGEELGAGVAEELLVDLCIALLHAQHFVTVLLPQLQVDALVNAHGVHGEGDGQQGVHLLVLLVDLRHTHRHPPCQHHAVLSTVPEGAGGCTLHRKMLYMGCCSP